MGAGETMKGMENYRALYATGVSSRYINEGYIGIHYRLPKFAKLFCDTFAVKGPLNVLELGAGIGEMHDLISRMCSSCLASYTVSEYAQEAVDMMARRGLRALRLDACQIEQGDNSYDVVCSFDVMHHVEFPRRMAQEMLRVSRRWVYLCEANGISLVRKLGELNARARQFGEWSYLPRTYRSFFEGPLMRSIKIKPFYFLVPYGVGRRLLPVFRAISEVGERIPLLRWQSQSIEILLEKVTVE